jgi:hypothetical protein
MAKTKVLIAVKTYPQPSQKYDELVCTAGFREDGSWIRLYPVQFRKLDYSGQYKKWEWIEIDCERRTQDPRPETYHPRDSTVEPDIIGSIGTKDHWRERKEYALKKVYTDLALLIEDAKNEDWNEAVSLATFKPSAILDFSWKTVEKDWKPERINEMKQLNLFKKASDDKFELIPKVPYEFRYTFKDCNGKESTLMIEDWEVGALYWNCLKDCEGDEARALEKVRQKYFDHFTQNTDLHFFLGTTLTAHVRKFSNPFVIIGAFYPLKKTQGELSFE